MNERFETKLQRDLDALKAAGTYKHLRHITTPMAPEVHMEEAGDVIVLSSNNYLGLADHPDVVAAGMHRIALAFAGGRADGVDGRQVEDVEAQSGDVVEP